MRNTRAGLTGAAMLMALATTGCVTTAEGGPSLVRFDNPADACNAQRQPLIDTERRLSQNMMAGALIGGAVGAGAGAAIGDGDAGAILAGALIGGLLGGTLGYQEGLAQRHTTREDMLTEINQDAGVDAGRFSTTRGLIANLNACRNQQIDTIQADHAAGRISAPQARTRLDQTRQAVDQDNELIAQVLGHMARRTDTYLDAARRTTDLDDQELLGQAYAYAPGQILWNDSTAAVGKPLEVKVDSANLRAGPGTNHRQVGSLRRGDVVTEAGRSGDWVRIAHDSEPAFIHANLVQDAGRLNATPRAGTARTVTATPTPTSRPEVKTEVQRAVVESRDATAVGEQSHAQLSSRLDDMYTILGAN